MADASSRVQELLERLVAEGPEVGLQAAAYLEGELVVDAWAGTADERSGTPVGPDTLFTVFSTSKGVTATCVHLLADRGKLDYDDPIAEHWPEFAANGKAGVTIRHALTHTAGIPQNPPGYTTEMMIDWERMSVEIAALEPRWEPGTQAGYHGDTYGFILGELVRRVDGRRIDGFLQEEICRPLGIDSMFFGVPASEEHRVATLVDAPPPPPDVETPTTFLKGLRVEPVYNRSDVRRAVIPSHGGIMSARTLARHYALLERGGELDGVRLLSPERVRLASELQFEGPDTVLGFPIRRALGYARGGTGFGAMRDLPEAFGHGGLGGSEAFVDPGRRLAFAFVKNYIKGSSFERPAADVVYREVVAALGLSRQEPSAR